MKTIATTIKADVVIYQDGSVEVIPEATGEPPYSAPLFDVDAFLLRRTITPGVLADAGLNLHYWGNPASRMVDWGERVGFDWAMAELERGREDRVADLNFDPDAKTQQAVWCINSEETADVPLPKIIRTYLESGWSTGFHYAVCLALRQSATFRDAYQRAERLAQNADIPNEEPAPTH
jgi:hypothetical protein